MYRPTLRRQALRLGLLATLVATLVVLALSACGGDEKKAKARPLPEEPKALRPGTYRSEEFKPSLSFQVGKGWSSTPLEASDLLGVMRGETAGLGFVAAPHQVYKPSRTGSPNLVEAPEDLVGWFQHHPYLKTSKPEPVTVGGVKGQQFDMVVENLPNDYHGVCGQDCVDQSKVADGRLLFQPKGVRTRLIVLKDVEGKTVTVTLYSQTTEFDEFTPKAQKVVDSVKWTGS
jgi:mRNA-degrading endonuclease HigB of HigAB toxin-antitoxin module